MSCLHITRDRQNQTIRIKFQDSPRHQEATTNPSSLSVISGDTSSEAPNFVESSFHSSSETAHCLIPWHSLLPINISVWPLQITWHFGEGCNS